MYPFSLLILLITILDIHVVIADQAPCAALSLSNGDFAQCPNYTLAELNITTTVLDNGNVGILNVARKSKYYDTTAPSQFDQIVTVYVCYNDFGECPSCLFANYSNNTDSLTLDCLSRSCVCSNITQKERKIADIGSGFSDWNSTGYGLIDIDSGPYVFYTGNPSPFGYLPSLKRTITVFVNWEQPIITVTPSSPVEIHIWVSLLSNNKMITCNGTCSFAINEAWLITSEDLWVTVYQEDVEIYEKSFKTDPVSFCPIPNNPFSSVWKQSWDCMGPTGRFLYVSALIGSVIIIISLIMLLIKIGKCFWEQYQNKIHITINNGQNQGNDDESDIVPLDDVQTDDFITRIKRGNTLSRKSFMSIMFFCLICTASASSISSSDSLKAPACMNSVIASSETTSCTAIPGQVTCQAALDVLINIPGVGGSACLDFLHPDTKLSLFKIVTTYKKAVYQVPLKKLYYTSDWRPMSKSVRYCPGTFNTQSAMQKHTCDNYANMTCFLRFDEGLACLGVASGTPLESLCTDRLWCLPGQQGCSYTSNKDCGAFDFDEATLFYKYAYLPVGHVYKVLEPENVYLIPELGVEIWSDGNYNNFTITYTDSVNDFGGVIARIIGNLAGELINFNGNKFVLGQDGNESFKAYFGPACNQNVPCSGGIGDIQSSSPGAFSSVSVDSSQPVFKFPPNAVGIANRDGTIDFTFPPRGLVSNIPVITQLPAVINGELWTISDETLYVNAVNAGPLVMQITAPDGIQITQTINTVCPEVSVSTSSLIGCSNCPQGLLMTVRMFSSCLTGPVTLSLEPDNGNGKLLTNTFYIDSDPKDYDVRIMPTSDTISGTVTFHGTGGQVSVYFTALTPELETTTNDTVIPVIVNPDTQQDPDISSGSGLNSFLDWFNSLDGWKAGVKWTVIAVVLTIVGIMLLVIIIKVLSLLRG